MKRRNSLAKKMVMNPQFAHQRIDSAKDYNRKNNKIMENITENFSYFLNWMGPLRKDFIDKYGDGWSTGRIDVDGPEEIVGHYGMEYIMPMISNEDWNGLKKFLWNLETPNLLTRDEIFKLYEEQKGSPITKLIIKEN